MTDASRAKKGAATPAKSRSKTRGPVPKNEHVSQYAFAAIAGVSRQYVSELVKKGKIRLEKDGKIDVQKALKRLKEVADPADSLRKATAGKKKAGEFDFGIEDYQRSRAAREYYAAQTEKLEYEIMARQHVAVDEVLATWEKFAAAMRTSIRSLPRQLAPLLHGREIGEIEAMLQDAVDQRLLALAEDPLGLKERSADAGD